MQAHVPTLLMMVTVSSVAMAAALLLLSQGRRQDGLAHWAGALLLGGAGGALFLLRGRVPDGLSLVLGNALMSAMFAVLLAAVQRFHGRTPHWPLLLALPVAMAVLMAGVAHSLFLRVLLSNLLLAAQALWLLWSLHAFAPGVRGAGKRLLVAGLALQAAVLLVRSAVADTLAGHNAGGLADTAAQSLTLMAAFIGLLAASMGFVFMGRERADQHHRRLAAQDGLTGVANRRSIVAALDRDVARCLRTREPLALMMVGVDPGPQHQGRPGPRAGDAVLRHVAGVLSQRVRAQDIVGRYGDGEFLLVLPDTGQDGAHQLALTLCAEVQATPCVQGGETLEVTVSIGVFGGRLEPQDHWDLLLHAADSALGSARAAGRSRVHMASRVSHVTLPETEAGAGFEPTFPPSV